MTNPEIISAAMAILPLILIMVAAYWLARKVIYDIVDKEFHRQQRIQDRRYRKGLWRPMEDAPRDGTKIAILRSNGTVEFLSWGVWAGIRGWGSAYHGPIEERGHAWFELPQPVSVKGDGQ